LPKPRFKGGKLLQVQTNSPKTTKTILQHQCRPKNLPLHPQAIFQLVAIANLRQEAQFISQIFVKTSNLPAAQKNPASHNLSKKREVV
jgi:hypothetical protein